jgi:toxin ParE1/3/4
MIPIVWSERALDDLDNIIAYVGVRSPQAGLRLYELIEASVRPAGEFPDMFRKGRVRGTREIVAHPNYIVVYRATVRRILVVAVIHARQKYP